MRLNGWGPQTQKFYLSTWKRVERRLLRTQSDMKTTAKAALTWKKIGEHQA